ncbi:YceI family protein [Spongiimicrobium salis]|uniref:YceI family protein n=1 Tax=Spongiimicrobium salis TaxID=1667022 RepID=UPI00374CF01F
MKILNIILTVLFLTIATSFSQNDAKISNAEITYVYTSSNVKGSIKGFSSSSTIDWNDIANSKFKGSVKTETLKTGNVFRDWSIRGKKYFNKDKYPLITFESTAIVPKNNGYAVTGNLSLKGITKEIEISFKKEGKMLIGKTTLYSSDFDINVKKKREANKVVVTFKFEVG